MRNEWTGFVPGVWEKEIDVRDFIQKNYTPYDGDAAFLAGPTEDTKALWQQVLELSRAEREAGGVLDMDTRVISTITSHAAGYLDKEKETIVGFQTEKPFKRALMPYGGIRMAQGRLRPREADIGRALVQGLADLFGTHALMQGGPCLLPYPLRRLDGGQDDQGNEAALTRIQAALSGDLAIFQALPDSRQFGIRPGQCRGPRLAQFLPVRFRFLHPVHGVPHDIFNGCAGCPGMRKTARCRIPGNAT